MMTMTAHILAAATDPNTNDLAKWLRGIFGPLFLVVIGIVALFFLFTREITRFVQFIVLAIGIAVIFYYPGIITSIAGGIATALGVSKGGGTG
jgi:hypothetical protein